MKVLRLLKRELAHEAKDWTERKIINQEQADAILRLYGAKYPTGEEHSRSYYVLVTIASIFIGLAAILIVSQNWEDLSRGTRMGALIGLTLTANCIGVHFFKRARLQLAAVWLLLGSLLYGASIFLIAQIYHLGEHYPNGVFYWALGTLPVAMLAESVALAALVAVLSYIWASMEISLNFMPWLAIIFIAALGYFSVKIRESSFLFLAVVVGALLYLQFLVASGSAEAHQNFSFEAINSYLGLGSILIVYALGVRLERTSSEVLMDYGSLLRIWALRGAAVAFVLLSFKASWIGLIKEAADERLAISLVLVLIAILGAAILASGRSQAEAPPTVSGGLPGSSDKVFLALSGLTLCLLGLSIAPFGVSPLLLAVFVNFMILFTGIHLITNSVQHGTQAGFYLGVVLLLTTAICRYLDLVGGYLGGAMVFLIAAVVLIAAARYSQRNIRNRAGSA